MRTYYIFLAVLAIAITAGTVIFLNRSYEVVKGIMIEERKASIAAAIQEKAANALSPEDFVHGSSPAAQASFRKFWNDIQAPELVRIKFWGEDSTVLWSNLPELIGQKFLDNQEVKEAFEGGIEFEYAQTQLGEKSESVSEREFTRLHEIYIPIFQGSREPFGVIELYQPAEFLDQAINDRFQKGAIPIIGMAIGGYVILAYALKLALRKRAGIVVG